MTPQDIAEEFARYIGSDDPMYVAQIRDNFAEKIGELVKQSVEDMRQQKDLLMDRWKEEQKKRIAYGELLSKCVDVMQRWIVPDGKLTDVRAMSMITEILDNKEAFKVLSPDIVKPRLSSYDPS